MVELKDSAIRLYRRLFGSPTAAEDHAAGIQTILTGERAVAICEATITQAGVVNSAQQSGDGGASWQFRADADVNTFGQPLSTMQTESARGAMAAAIGLGLSGRRATTFLNGQDVAGVQDLLFAASGRHLPLVVHLTSTALAGHGGVAGSGHEGFHLSSDSGCFTLFAANVQEAVDFTYIARRVAEQCLVPGLVAMDAEQTAWSVQDVHLLAPKQIEAFIGPAEERIVVPTVAQRLLFGRERRRVPRWHDVDRPVLQGALYDRDSYALGAVGRHTFFDSQLQASLRDAMAQFESLTGRRYALTTSYRLAGADTVFVAQGSAIETARAAVDFLEKEKGSRVGVLGVSGIRPLPAGAIHDALTGKRSVIVLERLVAAPDSEGPLGREIQLALSRGGDSARLQGKGSASKQAAPPVCRTVAYGIGGAPLRIADLALLPGRTLTAGLALGVDFVSRGEERPKREVLIDTLERAYPGLADMGLRAPDSGGIPLPKAAFAIAVTGKTGSGADDIASTVGLVLHSLEQGRVRSRLERSRWAHDGISYLVHSPVELDDPGDDAAIDLLVLASAGQGVDARLARRLREGGLVLFAGASADGQAGLPAAFMAEARDRRIRCFLATPAEDDDRTEFLTGAICSLMSSSAKKDIKPRKFVSTRQNTLKNVPADERHALVDAFQRGFDACTEVDMAAITGEAAARRQWDGEAPATVRLLGRDDNQFDSLPRFWDQVGVYYNDGEAERLTADPYFATGTVAPLSATFRDFSDARSSLPQFDPSACTGCGKCWTACPDSAIGAVAMTPATLIDMGMRVAGADALRQVANQLAARVLAQARQGELATTADKALLEEFEWLKEKMSMNAERLEVLTGAVNDIAQKLGSLPLAVTGPFFHEAEKSKKDSGELLSLAINPDTCKACGICVQQCEPLALVLDEQEKDALDRSRTLWNTWAETPDTPAETIERVIADGSVSPLAALNLSRYCAHTMAGGDSAEPGSGEKIALRMVLAATEFHQQPLLNRFAHDVGETLAAVVERIQGTLASVLPGDDLEALDKVLDRVGSPRMDLGTLAQEIDSVIEGRNIDARALRRLTVLAGELSDLRQTLSRGTQGLGRARFGLAITPGSVAEWAGEFPYNAFQSPVVIDLTGETAQMAAGLLEGHLRDTCEAIATLRKADLEMEQPAGIDFERRALEQLKWQGLTPDERRLCPPLIVVGNDQLLAGAGLSQILWLLSSELPIKFVALAELDFSLTGGVPAATHHDPRTNLGLLCLATRNAYVAQTSIASFDHLQASVREAMAFAGPALIRVHVPSPARHGIPLDAAIRQAELAYKSRACPLFVYNPELEGVHGTRISLAGNPEVKAPWVVEDEATLTPAHWALSESRFDGQFGIDADDDGTPVEITEYLALAAAARRGKVPVVQIGQAEGESRAVPVRPGLLEVIEQLAASWQVLQELAGIVTPFTDRVREEAREEVTAEHAKAMDDLKAEYEDKIAQLTANVQQEMATRIRGQLMHLVKLKPSKAQADVSDDGG